MSSWVSENESVHSCRDHNVGLFNNISQSNNDQVTVICIWFHQFELYCKEEWGCDEQYIRDEINVCNRISLHIEHHLNSNAAQPFHSRALQISKQ